MLISSITSQTEYAAFTSPNARGSIGGAEEAFASAFGRASTFGACSALGLLRRGIAYTVAQADKQQNGRSARCPTPPPTNRDGLAMSVNRGGPEVTGRGSNRRF